MTPAQPQSPPASDPTASSCEPTAPASTSDELTLLVFSGERDKLLAAFVMATGAVASGMKATMFFTFWATPFLKRRTPPARSRTFIERMFGFMLPGGAHRSKLSRLDMLGIGRRLMSREMKRKGIADLDEMIDLARGLGVRVLVCDMSMSLMGIASEDLVDYPELEVVGVATFLELASRSGTTLFIG